MHILGKCKPKLNFTSFQKISWQTVLIFIPFFAGPPATIEVDIMVRSMGPISEVDMVSQENTMKMKWTLPCSRQANPW